MVEFLHPDAWGELGVPAGKWEIGCYYRCMYPEIIPDTSWEGDTPYRVVGGTVFYCMESITVKEKSPLGHAFVTETDYLRLGCLNNCDSLLHQRYRFLHVDPSARHPELWQKITSPLLLLALQETDLVLLESKTDSSI